jgi:Ca2+-binding RTX toxin-like protein
VLSNGDVLLITGGRDDDIINVNVNHGHKMQTIVVHANGQTIGRFSAETVATIEFHGFAGDDQIHISPRIMVKTILDGGAGNDSLAGGGGSNILLGGPGMDELMGRRARDLLIGGADRDVVFGHRGEDIVIGDETAHDGDTAALMSILAEWTSNDAFDVRVEKLTNGTAGLPALNDTTVIDDGVVDRVLGGPGRDWVFDEAMGVTDLDGKIHGVAHAKQHGHGHKA